MRRTRHEAVEIIGPSEAYSSSKCVPGEATMRAARAAVIPFSDLTMTAYSQPHGSRLHLSAALRQAGKIHGSRTNGQAKLGARVKSTACPSGIARSL